MKTRIGPTPRSAFSLTRKGQAGRVGTKEMLRGIDGPRRAGPGRQPDYQSEGRIYAAYILELHSRRKIAVLYRNDDYGRTT
jgi:hypothetical protein